jgi:hypothetical protein
MVAWPQARDERRRGSLRQRSCIVLGEKRLEAGEQGVVRKPLERQGSSVAPPGDRATADGERAPAARSSEPPLECAGVVRGGSHPNTLVTTAFFQTGNRRSGQ